jgi:hypothetical protein
VHINLKMFVIKQTGCERNRTEVEQGANRSKTGAAMGRSLEVFLDAYCMKKYTLRNSFLSLGLLPSGQNDLMPPLLSLLISSPDVLLPDVAT